MECELQNWDLLALKIHGIYYISHGIRWSPYGKFYFPTEIP